MLPAELVILCPLPFASVWHHDGNVQQIFKQNVNEYGRMNSERAEAPFVNE
jgi:hypothetical protein